MTIEPIAWTGWRGPSRDAIVPWLPDRLPREAKPVWQRKLLDQGLSGIAATEKLVLVVDRDANDQQDLFLALNADSGQVEWSLQYEAIGRLDYGNSPRATPLIHDNIAFLFGAFGHLHCVDLETGIVLWQKNIRDEFHVNDKLIWGTASSPLMADDQLIINPGAPDASLVALDPLTGDVIWQTPGAPAAFSSFVVTELNGEKQLIGYDKESLGGWSLENGKRLWRHAPKHPNDFNVPTPVIADSQLVVCTENNGTRLFAFNKDGRLRPEPLGTHRDLAPDSHTPVAINGRLFGIWDGLFCLDLKNNLRELWTSDDEAFNHYASIIASQDRILITNEKSELILLDATADKFTPLSRLKIFENDSGVFSHPAIVGSRLYVRGSDQIVCLSLS